MNFMFRGRYPHALGDPFKGFAVTALGAYDESIRLNALCCQCSPQCFRLNVSLV